MTRLKSDYIAKLEESAEDFLPSFLQPPFEARAFAIIVSKISPRTILKICPG